MALATKCPHCNTLFRVAADQLKLRGGIVRCGSCNEVFDGNAALHDPAALPPLAAHAAPPPAHAVAERSAGQAASAAEEQPYALDFDTSFDPYGLLPEYAQLKPLQPEELTLGPQWEAELESELQPAPDDALASDLHAADEPARQQLVESELEPEPEPAFETAPAPESDIEPSLDDESTAALPAESAADAERRRGQDAPPSLLLRRSNDGRREPSFEAPGDDAEPPPASIAADQDAPITPVEDAMASDDKADLEQLPEHEDEDEDTGEDEPGFVKQGRRRQRAGKMLRTLMAAGSLVLLLTLLAQGATTFRNQLAAQVPQLKPALVSLCAAVGCRVELPAQIDLLSIEPGELQSLAERTFSYATVLRNTSGGAQAWPYLELTLDDASDKAVLRRVIAPRDYLPQSINISKGFPPRSEQAVKLYFELAQLKASGYHIAIFYP
ncbi:DUF3426 domain-containing protein [Janthinobacterium sp. CG_S6]|uniref:DUF3426 domain-containing protein n=1 Tax=Janthinobacterium sp. CG_S6 TaxID=3071707 RepID=UPI002E0B722D|nr:putative Zn finger-like uncharacterized protein [Janthinobacterium sp. CG_S6]